MANLEEKVKDLQERNKKLVLKLQEWKMTAAQRESDILGLTRENNELRLKLSKHRSNASSQARKLDAAMQSNSEQALAHLVHVSNAVATMLDLTKNYVRERHELDCDPPGWSSFREAPNSEKVHKVAPLMVGGMSIQPVVALHRTTLDISSTRSPRTVENNVTERLPLQLSRLQEVYIPLQRIDAELSMNNEDEDFSADDDEELVEQDENLDPMEEPPNDSAVTDSTSHRYGLEVVEEEAEVEETPPPASRSSRIIDPLEGPSWLLDAYIPVPKLKLHPPRPLEPDSTTELEDSARPEPDTRLADTLAPPATTLMPPPADSTPRHVFTPTRRRRNRVVSPTEVAVSPILICRKNSSKRTSDARVLKVVVPKLRLMDDVCSPPKRACLSSAFSSTPTPAPVSASTPASVSASTPAPVSSPSLFSASSAANTSTSAPSPATAPAPSPAGATDHALLVQEAVPGRQSAIVIAESHSTGDNKLLSNSLEPAIRKLDCANAVDCDTNLDQSVREPSEHEEPPRKSSNSKMTLNSRNSQQKSRQNAKKSRQHEKKSQQYASKSNKSDDRTYEGCQSPVLDTNSRQDDQDLSGGDRNSQQINHGSRGTSQNLRLKVETSRSPVGDSDGSETNDDVMRRERSRRPRKNILYKDAPLNRKLRRER